ncbi:hypothetical protein BH20ACT3_BH20ACT3_17740 [soil metagenome]
MQESRSTLRTVSLAIWARSDGNGPSNGPSVPSRSAGTAAISEWTAALTSTHHARPAALAAARSVTVSSAGIIRSDFT